MTHSVYNDRVLAENRRLEPINAVTYSSLT
jgi:hypothetical protein